MTDEELMCRYQGGDRAAFQQLFRRHGGAIYRFFLQRMGSAAEAQDGCQRTWMRLHEARATFRGDGHFRAWLYTIALRVHLQGQRHRRSRPEDLSPAGPLPETATPATAYDHVQGRDVRRALLALPEGYRDVIILHRWHDLGFSEIAQAMGLTESAVKVRAHRGYVMLREILAKKDGS